MRIFRFLSISFYYSKEADKTSVIALVEYLTSDEAGQHLDGRFAWPVGLILNCGADSKKRANGHSNGSANGSAAKLNGNGKAANGNSINGHGNGAVKNKMDGANGKKLS